MDMEQIIEGLEKAKNVIEQWIPIFEQYNSPAVIDEAIKLLKEQEAVKPINECYVHPRRGEIAHMLLWCCGSCGIPITSGDKFCRMCGKKVKWK